MPLETIDLGSFEVLSNHGDTVEDDVVVHESSENDQCSLRHESNDRAKLTPKEAPPQIHQLQRHEVDVCREKEMPEAEASLRSSIDRRVNTS